MAIRLPPWVVGSVLLLAACTGGGRTLAITRPTAPRSTRGTQSPSPTTTPTSSPSVTPWGSPPVDAPPALQSTASAYYDGAGPSPEDRSNGRPLCLLLLPTGLSPTTVKPVPTSQFNVFGEFVVRWTLAGGRGTGVTMSALPPGDSTDRYFFASGATTTSYADGSELRTAPERPRAVLIRIANENCEYLLQPAAALPIADDASALLSLRLLFAPSA